LYFLVKDLDFFFLEGYCSLFAYIDFNPEPTILNWENILTMPSQEIIACGPK
jgi:hypothetical protein